MLYQNDKTLLEPIQKIGCFFRSCLMIAELKIGKDFSALLINNLWNISKEKGYIDKDDDVLKSAPIISMAFEYLGQRKKVYEIGTSIEGKVIFYPSVSKDYQVINARIEKISQSGISRTHFRVIEEGKVYCPHYPEIRKINEIYTILYFIKD